jgi:hypothetical protein
MTNAPSSISQSSIDANAKNIGYPTVPSPVCPLPAYFPSRAYFGMTAHIGIDAGSGLVHNVRGTAGNVNDVIKANTLLHGEET